MCNPPLRAQSFNEQEEVNMDERLKSLLKQKELLNQQRDLKEKLQDHFNISEMR